MRAARPIHPLPALCALLGVLLSLSACGAPAPRARAEPVAEVPAGPTSIDGLVEFGRGLLLRRRGQGEGTLRIDDDLIEWENDQERERGFSIQPKIVREVWLNCATKPGLDVCLELGIETVTGKTYHFRDRGWESGENRQVRRAFEELRRRFPEMRVEERRVREVS